MGERTIVISFPAAFLNDLVHRTFLGFRFILREGERRGGGRERRGRSVLEGRNRDWEGSGKMCLSDEIWRMMGECRKLWEVNEAREEGKRRGGREGLARPRLSTCLHHSPFLRLSLPSFFCSPNTS